MSNPLKNSLSARNLVFGAILYGHCLALTLTKPAGVLDTVTLVKSLEGGLYNTSDNVTILHVASFENTVFHSDRAWFVEFYNRWCGRCIRFAPVFKEFAADVVGWKAAVQIGVVDCAVEANLPLCRAYNIDHFPSLRYFTAYAEKGDIGQPIDHVQDISALRKLLVQHLERSHVNIGHGDERINLSPFTGDTLQKLWDDLEKSVQSFKNVLNAVLIFQDPSKEIGTDLVLDLSQVPQVYARVVPPENEAFARQLQVPSVPSVVVISRKHSTQNTLQPQNKTRAAFKSAIEAFLKLKSTEIPKASFNDVALVSSSESSRTNDISKQVEKLRSEKGNVAFLGDLEHALRYSLKHEISERKHMSGPMLQSLKDYLIVILKHFPLNKDGLKLMQMLVDHVEKLQELSGNDWSELLTKAESSTTSPAWTEREDFLGCRGSQTMFRGYPCSLWTMFHVLTVNAQESHNKSQPQDVLKAMLGYVTHFFGCTECSNHFQSMAAETAFSDAISQNDSVMWLWEAHNRVNKRLAGDATEDPKFPKIQFPSVDHCPKCHDGDAWVRPEVLLYLQSIYSHGALSDLGSANFEVYNSASSISDVPNSSMIFFLLVMLMPEILHW